MCCLQETENLAKKQLKIIPLDTLLLAARGKKHIIGSHFFTQIQKTKLTNC